MNCLYSGYHWEMFGRYLLIFGVYIGLPKVELPQVRWMVFIRDNPINGWMITKGYPHDLGKLYITRNILGMELRYLIFGDV